MTKHAKTASAGFTMIEAVVALAMVMALSAAVMFSFSGLTSSAAISRSSRELGLSIRRAQNMSLAVTRIDTSSGPLIPAAVGVRLDTANPSSYLLFADLVRDNRYNPADDAQIGPSISFERGVTVSQITGQGGGESVAHVMFAAPEAAVALTDSSGASIGDRITIELVTPQGTLTKEITVRTSGQISIK